MNKTSKLKKLRKDKYKEGWDKLQTLDERKWLSQRGKGSVMEFTDEELRSLKACFR